MTQFPDWFDNLTGTVFGLPLEGIILVVVFLVAAFPVYWMVLTSFRRGVDIQKATPQFVPSPGTLGNYRKVFQRDFFWTAVKNSLTVTLLVLVLSLFIAFLAAVAVSRFRFKGRRAFIVR